MALATALVLSISSVCMVSADLTTTEYSYDENSGFMQTTGSEPDIKFTYLADEEPASVTVEWGEMNFIYSPSVGWGSSFSGFNNGIRVESHCNFPIDVSYLLTINDDTLQDAVGFRVTTEDENGNIGESNNLLTYPDPNDPNSSICDSRTVAANETVEAYVTINNTTPTITGTYQDETIGTIGVEIAKATTA